MIQGDMFAPQSNWTPTPLSKLPKWGRAKRVAIDTETYDPGIGKKMGPAWRHGGYIVGFSVAIENGPAHYIPIRHGMGGNVDEDQALRWLRDRAKSFKGEIVGANLSYDLDYLANEGVVFPEVKGFRDVLIAAPLINELEHSYSLDAVAKRLGYPGKDEQLLKEAAQIFRNNKGKPFNAKSDLWKLHSKYVGPYGVEDAALPLKVYADQRELLDAEELWQVFDLESAVLPILVKMRRRGMLIDTDKLAQIEQWSLEQVAKADKEITRLTGCRIGTDNYYKAEALAKVLETIGVKVGKTAKGLPNVDKAVLSSIDHPVADHISWARRVSKLRTTFAASVRKYMVNGVLHPTLNQVKQQKPGEGDDDTKGAAYGRMSGDHPNIQQQPSRDEFADMWRSIYIARSGLFACNDYSQQEPRMTTHFAEKTNCKGAALMGDAYRTDPNTDNHDMMTTLIHGIKRGDIPTEKFEKIRKPCKDIYLGICYGMGGAKLARAIGLPTRWVCRTPEGGWHYFTTRKEAMDFNYEIGGAGRIWEGAGEEAQKVLDKFHEKAPYVSQLSGKAKTAADKKGYIRTLLGRHCHFPTDNAGNYDWTHKALNRLIQGSSGDQTKAALVAVDREVPEFNLLIQVHDELDGEPESPEIAKRAAEVMEHCVPLTIPSKVDVEIGPSWGEIKKVA